MKKNKINNFAMVYHIMFAKNTQFGVSDRAIYIYTGLQFLKTSYDMMQTETVVNTTILQLITICDFGTNYRKNKGEEYVINCLDELINSGYIKISNKKKNWKKEVLNVTLNKIELTEHQKMVHVDFKDNPFNFSGFEKVFVKEFKNQNYKDFSIYLYVKWRSNANFVYRISFEEWAYVLGVVEKTARNRISNCHSILKQTGRYKHGENKQPCRLPNTYYIKPSVVHSAKENLISKITDTFVLENPKLMKEMIDLSCFMTHAAYEKYKETDDEILKALAQDKIDVFSENNQGARSLARLEDNYQKNKDKEFEQIINIFENYYVALVDEIDDTKELVDRIFKETVSDFYLNKNTNNYKRLKEYANDLEEELKDSEIDFFEEVPV
ncbi:hypothetical protein [Vagococcus fluvialis]|uniref:hypothetical protein n=1 Tax=Vagococcus fluvialis TaxID=2738 RepID=UPI003B211536